MTPLPPRTGRSSAPDVRKLVDTLAPRTGRSSAPDVRKLVNTLAPPPPPRTGRSSAPDVRKLVDTLAPPRTGRSSAPDVRKLVDTLAPPPPRTGRSSAPDVRKLVDTLASPGLAGASGALLRPVRGGGGARVSTSFLTSGALLRPVQGRQGCQRVSSRLEHYSGQSGGGKGVNEFPHVWSKESGIVFKVSPKSRNLKIKFGCSHRLEVAQGTPTDFQNRMNDEDFPLSFPSSICDFAFFLTFSFRKVKLFRTQKVRNFCFPTDLKSGVRLPETVQVTELVFLLPKQTFFFAFLQVSSFGSNQ